MPITSANILRVVAEMSNGANDIQNVYHLRCTVSSDPGDTTVCSEIAAWLDTAYQYMDHVVPNQVTFNGVSVWNESTSTYLGYADFPTLSAGGATVTGMAPQLAPLVLFNTNINRSQGRKFLPFLGSDQFDDDGSPTSSILTILANVAAALLAGVSGTGWSGEPGNWNVNLSRFAPWATAIVRDIYATQRRRYLNRGS